MKFPPAIPLRLSIAAALAFSLPACGIVGGRSPSVDVLGSYFPAWFVCLIAALGLVLIARLLLIAARIPLVWPALVYPCLFAIFAMAIWLIFYRV